jgi:hypothetical protein
MRIILLIILISFLIYIFFYIQKSFALENIKYWKNIAPDFDLDDFKLKCGNEIIEVHDYSNNGKSTLFPNKTIKIKLIEWFDEKHTILSIGNKQTLIYFLNTPYHPITTYMLNWLNENKSKLPLDLVNSLSVNKFSIRISRGKWDYPSHFDAINTYMIIISGNRNVILNHYKKINLKPKDILYFGAGIYHHFWCDSLNDLNFILTISNSTKNNKIYNKFKKEYPQQMDRIYANKDFY